MEISEKELNCKGALSISQFKSLKGKFSFLVLGEKGLQIIVSGKYEIRELS